ncbi:MAG TPA: hypothetical protein VGC41_03905 [Kofleriaceae bacterium]
MTKLLGLAFALAFTGCTSDDGGGGDLTIDSTPLAGTVYGTPWTFTAGATDAFLSAGDDNFFSDFYATAFTCGGSTPSGAGLIVAVPKAPGDYPMSLMRNMTFTRGSDNKIATTGMVHVESVTATQVTGGLVGRFDDDNFVSGQFTLTICPDEN